MNFQDKVRRSTYYLIEKYGIDKASKQVDYFEHTGAYDEDFADAIRLNIAQLKRRRTPFTKYKGYHAYQTKVIE